MVAKTLVILGWALASYLGLILWASSWYQVLPLAVSLGLALAGIGFAVQHDGGHGSFSTQGRLNRLAAGTLDLLGGSSYVWNHKHNVLHHTFTNIEGADDDIEFHPFFRFSPGQPRYWFHRFQFLYWIPLFMLLSTKWIFLDDYLALARGAVAGHPMRRPRGLELAIFWGGKLFCLAWAVVIPLLLVPPLYYLAGYAVVSGVLGLTLGTVFQLAHAVEEASFFPPSPGESTPLPWAEHQLATTVDFARSNWLLTWYVGGLNHQVEHHLFPKVSHRHYRALGEIVREVCARHGVQPLEHKTMSRALWSNLRHMYLLGRPLASPAAAPAAPPPVPVGAL